MSPTTCLIFDLFGTLVDYEPVRTNLAYRYCYESTNCAHSYEEFVAAWESCFSRHEKTSAASGLEFHMHAVAADVCERLGKSVDNAPALAEAFIEDWQRGIIPVTGVTGLLTRLANHYRLALISNTHYPPMVQRLLSEMQLQPLFDVISLSVEVGVPKPGALIFEKTLAAMDVTPDQAVYIGDNFDTDYVGAKKAGLDCYLIGRHARVPRDRQLRSIMDLPIYFKTEKK